MADADSNAIPTPQPAERRTMSRIDQIDELSCLMSQCLGIVTALQRSTEEAGGYVHQCSWALSDMLRKAQAIVLAEPEEAQS